LEAALLGQSGGFVEKSAAFIERLISAIDFKFISCGFSTLISLDFSMKPFLKIPIQYWLVSCIAVLWFAIGVIDYAMISYKIPTYTQSMPEALQYWFDR